MPEREELVSRLRGLRDRYPATVLPVLDAAEEAADALSERSVLEETRKALRRRADEAEADWQANKDEPEKRATMRAWRAAEQLVRQRAASLPAEDREAQTAAAMLAEFHHRFNYEKTADPSLRLTLHQEEHDELVEALESGDLEAIARELADVVYVAYGSAWSLGIDLDAALREVHRANMSKLGDDGKPVYRDDGKVLKGPNFRPPDLRLALEGHPVVIDQERGGIFLADLPADQDQEGMLTAGDIDILAACFNSDGELTALGVQTPEETVELFPELAVITQRVRAEKAEAQVEELRAELAECYRLSGADPDGDSDAMLAGRAVKEVRRLREECDEAEGVSVAALFDKEGK